MRSLDELDVELKELIGSRRSESATGRACHAAVERSFNSTPSEIEATEDLAEALADDLPLNQVKTGLIEYRRLARRPTEQVASCPSLVHAIAHLCEAHRPFGDPVEAGID